MAGRGILVTGTDTGVGKTFVGCGLLAALRSQGLRVAPFKPAETGCETDAHSGELIPADAVRLREAAGSGAPLEVICPYRFSLPVAPWVAAQREAEIDPAFLVRQFERLAAAHDLVVVETAGGILVPLNEQFHFGDLARRLRLPVLVVAASRLGVLNHTLLTLEYLRAAGLPTLGVILNHPASDTTPAVATNEETLRKLGVAPLFVLAYHPAGRPNPADAVFAALASQIRTQLAP
ncbi:MAG TPA: dethiobiotin synthase [Terriglobia bacterium]|nr:dethiobiotin synthase [Terriglobia bacterium]